MIKELVNYIKENEFKMTIYKDGINVCNYNEIITLESDKIILKYDDSLITIRGDNLSVSKLLNREILIKGIIKKIEIGDYSV